MNKIETDKSIIVCKYCNETKERILAGKYPSGKDKRWVDKDGQEFSGHTCPSCHSLRVNQRKQLKKKNSYV